MVGYIYCFEHVWVMKYFLFYLDLFEILNDSLEAV